MEVISLKDAKAASLKYYYTGKPCKHGHDCRRKVNDRTCVKCNSEKSKRNNSRALAWYYDNPERAKENRRKHYEQNTEVYKEKAREWEQDHPERTLELKRSWRKSEKGIEQSRQWTDANREAHYMRTKDWKARNPGKVNEYTGTRRAARMNATPAWLTEEDRIKIRSLYEEAKKREIDTGIKWHVDHIVALQHKRYCGLHVPWNLQVLTASENAAKGNRMLDDEDYDD